MTKAKGNSLQAMLTRVAASPAEPAPAPASAPKPAKAARTAAREGTKLIGGHFPPEISTQLRILAAEEGTTLQSLLDEAIRDLLTKKGRGVVSRA